MARAAPDIATAERPDRRRHHRLPVTLPARVHHAARCFRATILDVSNGGLLLSPIAALPDADLQTIDVEALSIGRVRARVVGVSRFGIHAEVEDVTAAYQDAVKRLTDLTQTWNPGRP